MDHARESLLEHVRATAEMIKDYPDDEGLKRELYALISSVSILEMFMYDEIRTKYSNYVTTIEVI